MKRILFSLLCIGTLSYSNAQIGIGTTDPEASSILDVESSTRGFLLPRVSEHTVVVDPAIGLMVYDLTDHCINVFVGNATWKNLCEGSGGSGGGGGTGIIVTPPTNDPGTVNLATKICFDISESNDITNGCGPLSIRNLSKADFSDVATHSQTLTISSSTAITDIVVQAVDPSGNVILNANPPLVDNLSANGSTTALIEYKQDLNTSALGLDHASRFTTTIYVTYKELGVDKQVSVSPFVKDCECSSNVNTHSWNGSLINQQTRLLHTSSGASNFATSGRPGTSPADSWLPITGVGPVLSSAEAYAMAAAVGENGKLYVWGYTAGLSNNYLGNIASVSLTPTEHPNAATSGETFVNVGLTEEGIVALTASGKLYGGGDTRGLGPSATAASYSNFAEITSIPKAASAKIVNFKLCEEGMIAIDDQGFAYAGGHNHIPKFGRWTSTSNGGPNDHSVSWTKLGIVNSVGGTINDFPGKVIDAAVTLANSAILLEDGTIYVTGDNRLIKGESTESRSYVGASGVTFTVNYSPLIIDGDASALATKMGVPTKIWMTGINENGGQAPTSRSSLYVLDDKGDLYGKGYGGPLFTYWAWPSASSTDGSTSTFKKVDLSFLDSGDEIVQMVMQPNFALIISANGKVYVLGNGSYDGTFGSTPSSANGINELANPGYTGIEWRR